MVKNKLISELVEKINSLTKRLEQAEKKIVGIEAENAELKTEITEYQIHKATCPVCGKLHKGIAPEGVNAPVQYGNNVKAYAVLLNVHFKLPFKKIQLLFGDLFGYSINESTVFSASRQCYEKLEKNEKIIKKRQIYIGQNKTPAK